MNTTINMNASAIPQSGAIDAFTMASAGKSETATTKNSNPALDICKLDDLLNLGKEAAAELSSLNKNDSPLKNIASFLKVMLKVLQEVSNLIHNRPGEHKSNESGNSGSCATDTSPPQPRPLDSANPTVNAGRYLNAAVDESGAVSIVTADGYTVHCPGQDQSWSIIAANGLKTRVWGDPHVVESDGDTWDFKERSTFLFGNNKVTVDTVPAGNGESYTGSINVYHGNERVSISGIDTNQPRISTIASDASTHDASFNDGDVYTLSTEANSLEEEWIRSAS